MILSLDTETTGVDLYHGAKPFIVTTCADDGKQLWWEWSVDPLTRQPEIPGEDLDDIRELLEAADELILQNAKFDATALAAIGIELPWEKVHDLLDGSHLLASNRKKDLTALSIEWLDENPEHFELTMKKACEDARKWTKKNKPEWMIAKTGLSTMPSIKKSADKKKGIEEKPWKNDCWLPKAICEDQYYGEDHPWWSVTAAYANSDSENTLLIWPHIKAELNRRGLWKIYEKFRRKLPLLARKMEKRGVTASTVRLHEILDRYETENHAAKSEMLDFAKSKGYDLKLPKAAAPNDSLRGFFFNALGAEKTVSKKAKTSNPSLSAEILLNYSLTWEGEAQKFVKTLLDKRARDGSLTQMRGYEKFWLPYEDTDTRLLHPNINPTGTGTLRWSHSNPNSGNISAKESECKECDGEGCKVCNYTGKKLKSVRYCFGPAPGREWWSFDFRNIERRIPVYESKEEIIMHLFEHPDDAPYYGSEHLVVAHILYPKEFEACKGGDGRVDGRAFKDLYKRTLYQWVKNGNFAIQYQCGDATGDATFKLPGACRKVRSRFSKQTALNDYWVDFAERHGYVETMPDKDIDPTRGYPLLCTRSESGYILPTVPLNYHSSGTAMWVTGKAMIAVDEITESWNEDGFDSYMTLQIHDELVWDAPQSTLDHKGRPSNYWRAEVIREAMAAQGNGIGIPTPVNAEWHPKNWSEHENYLGV